jgi:hypothetical protein
MLRNVKRITAGLVLAALLAGCGGAGDPERLRVYHLEAAIGRPAATGELRCGPPRPACPGVLDPFPRRTHRYAAHLDAAVASGGFELASARREQGPDGVVVFVPLTDSGRRAFAAVTRAAARYGGRDQAWHHLAIVVDDEIVAFPEVDFDEFPDGIAAARGIVIPTVGDADARELVKRLRAGS